MTTAATYAENALVFLALFVGFVAVLAALDAFAHAYSWLRARLRGRS